MIELYTDGSAKNNGAQSNQGGWGIAIFKKEKGKNILINYYSGQEKNTTNNRMEICAILNALKIIEKNFKEEECIIKSDSAYCVNMFNQWIHNWARNNWIGASKQPVKNIDLVQQLYPYATQEFPNYILQKIPGHSGYQGNELADALATDNKEKQNKILKEISPTYKKMNKSLM